MKMGQMSGKQNHAVHSMVYIFLLHNIISVVIKSKIWKYKNVQNISFLKTKK